MSKRLAVLAEQGIVVTANKRLARSILLEWNHKQRQLGLAAWRRPQVLTWRNFITLLHQRSYQSGGKAGRQLLLAGSQTRLLWQDIIAASGPDLLPGADSLLAAQASEAWQLMQEWHIAPAELEAAADSQESEAFAAWARRYQARCEADGWTDFSAVSGLLAAELRKGLLAPPEQLHLAGFLDPDPARMELLQALSAQGTVISMDPDPVIIQGVHRRCGDPGDELEEAARWARQWASDEPQARIGIVVPDLAARSAEVRRRILDIIDPHWRLESTQPSSVNFSLGQPLARNGLVHAALRTLECLSGQLDYRHANELLMSRYMPGAGSEASERAKITWALGQQLGNVVSLERLTSMATEMTADLGQRLQRLAAVIEEIPGRQTPGRWADSFRQMLESVGWPGEEPLDSSEYQAANAWQELLDELRSCDIIPGELGRQGALRLLRGMADERLFQPEGSPGGIQVLGAMEAMGQHFDALWISGMTAKAWPPVARGTALLPLWLQRKHGMPGSTPALVRKQAEKMLAWLSSGAPEVVFSSPSFEGDEPLAPSPLIAGTLPADDHTLRRWPEPRWAERMLGSTQLELLDPDPPPPAGRHERLHGGASLLEREAHCPARAFIQYRLGAQELPVPATGIDASRRGSITHKALEYFFTGMTRQSDLLLLGEEEQARQLDKAIARAIRRCLSGDMNPFLRQLAGAEQLRQHGLLTQFLALERERPAFRILSMEKVLSSVEEFPALHRLRISLRPDRIDMLEDGSRLVIDYKTGRKLPPRNAWEGRLQAPQLPLYATLAGADGIAFVQIAAGAIQWQGVAATDCGIDGVQLPEKNSRAQFREWPALQAWWRKQLETLAGEVLAGCFDVNRKKPWDSGTEWHMAIRPQDLADTAEEEEL